MCGAILCFPGNSSLAYLMLNATLCQGEKEQLNTKYLLMQIEPNRDYSFEITKNVRIPAGEYNCTLEAKVPRDFGWGDEEVQAVRPMMESSLRQIPVAG